MPFLGIEFVPMELTIVVLATSLMGHGTAELQCDGDVERIGSSHFVRVPDLQNLCWLKRGLRIQGNMTAAKMEEYLQEEMAEAADEDKGTIKGKYTKARKEAIEIGKAGKAVVHQERAHKGLMLWMTKNQACMKPVGP